MTTHWKTLDADLGLYTTSYAFNGGAINTLVVALGGGKLLVAGPGTDVSDAAYAELDALGEVSAVVSAGPFHHLGMPGWKLRYPGARLFAGPVGCARITKQHKGVDLGLETLDALKALLPDHVDAVDVAGMRQPDLHLVVRDGKGGSTWFSNEVLTNEPEMPKALPVKLLFQLTGTGTGLIVNNFTRLAFGGAKKPIGDFFRAQLAASPATRLVPSHGQIAEGADLPGRLQAIFDQNLA
jgi:hypothetical protein